MKGYKIKKQTCSRCNTGFMENHIEFSEWSDKKYLYYLDGKFEHRNIPYKTFFGNTKYKQERRLVKKCVFGKRRELIFKCPVCFFNQTMNNEDKELCIKEEKEKWGVLK